MPARRLGGGAKQLRMEYFYRDMRRDTRLLMEDGAPTGGKWNFDHDNASPRAAGDVPAPASFAGRHHGRGAGSGRPLLSGKLR